MATDYRTSHDSAGYGTVYSRTYEVGYYRHQWELIERPLLSSVLRDLAAGGARSALDFACGTGRITEVLAEHFAPVVGVDVAEEMLRVARERLPSVEFVCRDLTREPLDRTVDVATAFRFFLNADPGLRHEALVVLHRLLAPRRGALVANVHVNAASILGAAYRTRNWLSRRTVAKVMTVTDFATSLTQAGFRIERLEYYGFLPRVGWWFPAWLGRAMLPVENMAQRLRFPPARTAQCFLVVARPE